MSELPTGIEELPFGIERREFLFLQAFELEKLVEATYGVKYRFSVDEEVSLKLFDVRKGDWPSSGLADQLDDIKKGRSYYSTTTLLQDLANRDLIPEGNYLIRD